MRRWPDTLPTPSGPGFGLSPVDPVIRSDMEVGMARVRRVTFARQDIVDMAWRFTDAEMAAFRAWWNDEPWSLAGDSDSLTGWTLNNATIAADALVGPDLVLADRIVEDVATSSHYVSRSLGAGGLASSTVLCRATIKASGRSHVRFGVVDRAGTVRWTWVDLAAGTLGSQSGLVSRTLQDRGNGWWRVTITALTGVGGSNPVMQIVAASDGSTTVYAGSGAAALDVCEIGARIVTGYDLHLRTDAAGNALGAAGSAGWAEVPVAAGGGFNYVEARFKGPFKATALSGLNWDVSAQMEVRNG